MENINYKIQEFNIFHPTETLNLVPVFPNLVRSPLRMPQSSQETSKVAPIPQHQSVNSLFDQSFFLHFFAIFVSLVVIISAIQQHMY